MAEASVTPNPVISVNGTPTEKTADDTLVRPSLPASRTESFHSAVSSFNSTDVNGVSKGASTNDTPASSTNASEPEEEDFKIPTDGPLKVPIPKPLPKSKVPPQTPLTPDQASKYATVLAKVSTWKTLPMSTAKKATQEPLTDGERMWLTRECLLRYLRATKWNVNQALVRLQSTLTWRREYGADTFTFDYISPENETGKQVIMGYDNDARPCLYLNPAKQNTDMSDRQIHHLCFMLDRTVDMMPPGQENATLLINFKGASSGKTPTVGQARAVLNILQNHNPERLGRALISQLPWYVSTFFKLISPFIDPVTREKMRFNEDLRDYIPAENLWNHHEGDLNFEYDHSVYWPALQKDVERRRAAATQRWEKAGKLIGEYEEYLRGGNHRSLQQELDAYKPTPDPTPDRTPHDSQANLVSGLEKMKIQEANA
ncbi:CRAL-TRIO domain-containing protein [Neohortaea acidophila]|uniref:CRAL-TRIO domain-containing protein n=1 Tax=Neohortaea acidophila TaxID=245834 RepID=A0A6A6Q2J4_9PEZI|nr:CRAL-TRIO domain-containing protein [Neohortaea acidophila]KAF2486214.1 CRAL-TRIO domain-containing protein [Neohortaea acidophila]